MCIRDSFDTVLHISHALKGTLGMFGAQPARELAQQIESCASRADGHGAELFVSPFVTEVEHLMQVLSERGPL